MASSPPPLGAILAGGASRRFGRPKALAEVGGRRIVERVHDALAAVVPAVGLIANEPERFRFMGAPVRPDVVPGLGPLGGIHAALGWAREQGRPGALCIACDMPFLTAALLRAILDRAGPERDRAVVPESNGPRGVEPLCAYYPVAALPVVEARIERGERALHGLVEAVGARRLPLAEVRRVAEPDTVFFNINRPGDHRAAEGIADAPPSRR